MRINYMKRFREAYAKAFDEKNQLRTCPRQVYKELIIACSRIDKLCDNRLNFALQNLFRLTGQEHITEMQ